MFDSVHIMMSYDMPYDCDNQIMTCNMTAPIGLQSKGLL